MNYFRDIWYFDSFYYLINYIFEFLSIVFQG